MRSCCLLMRDGSIEIARDLSKVINIAQTMSSSGYSNNQQQQIDENIKVEIESDQPPSSATTHPMSSTSSLNTSNAFLNHIVDENDNKKLSSECSTNTNVDMYKCGLPTFESLQDLMNSKIKGFCDTLEG